MKECGYRVIGLAPLVPLIPMKIGDENRG